MAWITSTKASSCARPSAIVKSGFVPGPGEIDPHETKIPGRNLIGWTARQYQLHLENRFLGRRPVAE